MRTPAGSTLREPPIDASMAIASLVGMPKEKDTQVAPIEMGTSPPGDPAFRRTTDAAVKAGSAPEPRSGPERMMGGLERVREILLGDILAELERRLARIDNQLANRTSELQLDARHRTDVLDAHVRKEVDALSTRAAHDSHELGDSIRVLRREKDEAFAQIEQRFARLEERLETSIARMERDARQQLLDQAKTFLNELERVRHQLRSAIIRELGLEPAPSEERGEHDGGTWTAPH